MRARIVLVYIAIAFLWGSTWSVIRIGLEHLPPLRFAGIRMALAAALLAPFALRGGAWRVLVGEAGRLASRSSGCSRSRSPTASCSWRSSGCPPGSPRSSSRRSRSGSRSSRALVLPGERLTPRKLASAAIGVAGIAVLQAPHLGSLDGSGRLALGSALIVSASIIVALANVLVRRHLVAISPLAMTAGQTFVGRARAPRRGAPPRAGPPRVVHARRRSARSSTSRSSGRRSRTSASTGSCRASRSPRSARCRSSTRPSRSTLGAALLGESIGWHLAVGGGMVLAAAALATRDAPRAPDAG